MKKSNLARAVGIDDELEELDRKIKIINNAMNLEKRIIRVELDIGYGQIDVITLDEDTITLTLREILKKYVSKSTELYTELETL